ncbi:hypothetical protein OGAPHI_002230 [Ogataea philodendri]|uniref:Uncharacterized protein n=1 Tax=Ogataea philodendri TaxID=1378263 RepID=A0A9P8T743_9ASCO|nr:uncharacterized protein OGAPHI_002230 [Ogataea philodendri]KAH3668476.1 hypothetical protein OGAPHI_002230 [Ogataea philodendri]
MTLRYTPIRLADSVDSLDDGGEIRLVDSRERRSGCFDGLRWFFGGSSKVALSETESKAGLMYRSLDAEKKSDNESMLKSQVSDTTNRLCILRNLMKQFKIGVYIVPSEDEHQSETTSPKDKRRGYISKFTGSAGIAVISLNNAALSTDGRYYLQAERQLDRNWTLLKQSDPKSIPWQFWCLQEAADTSFKTIAVDPRLISYDLGLYFKEKCHNANLEFLPLMTNLIDKTMELEHFVPDLPANDKIFEHEMRFAGEHANHKLARTQKFLKEAGAFALIASQLEEIAWLFNLRGNSIPFSPVFFSYAIVKLDGVELYLDRSKLTPKVTQYLDSIYNLTIYSYSQFWDNIPALKNTVSESRTVYLSNNSSYALYMNLSATFDIQHRSILTEFKGIKNATEIEGNRFAQLKDSVALIRLFAWMDGAFLPPRAQLDEIEVATKAAHYRSLMPNFKGLAYDAISSSGPNASVVHYVPTLDNFSVVDPDSIFLLDSGAQYLDGTTDITRTLHFSRPSYEEIEKYTLVLRGHLNVALLEFTAGTPSEYIDSLARKPLIEKGLNYSHGTGHGIDTFICVHAGPCGLSPVKTSYNYKPLEPGNFISDEPGYYRDNEYGVRIESDLLVVQRGEKDGVPVLGFDYFTLVPFCRNLIDLNLLEPDQIKWINEYYKRIQDSTIPFLEKLGDTRAIDWLLKETRPLQ